MYTYRGSLKLAYAILASCDFSLLFQIHYLINCWWCNATHKFKSSGKLFAFVLCLILAPSCWLKLLLLLLLFSKIIANSALWRLFHFSFWSLILNFPNSPKICISAWNIFNNFFLGSPGHYSKYPSSWGEISSESWVINPFILRPCSLIVECSPDETFSR